ncbi:hypothetical protein Y032_0408g913 [Ancylostoma ceylanicum]|uniref:Uncharacterized protein n=1 Tax=Ancylostoma ceylanicum TaxID=53326 RepID=A0A016X3H5_9BILA|nr:hypothetical protein Y032_0408g913 [Ancylostoma ceylanicum]
MSIRNTRYFWKSDRLGQKTADSHFATTPAWGSPDPMFNVLYLGNVAALGGATCVELLGLSFRSQNFQNF